MCSGEEDGISAYPLGLRLSVFTGLGMSTHIHQDYSTFSNRRRYVRKLIPKTALTTRLPAGSAPLMILRNAIWSQTRRRSR
jgi:hypothetical protein